MQDSQHAAEEDLQLQNSYNLKIHQTLSSQRDISDR